MKTILYTAVRLIPGETLPGLIKKAQRLGFVLVPFNGWTNQDIGYAGNPGPAHEKCKDNMSAIKELQDALEIDGDWHHILCDAEEAPAGYVRAI